jgi:hypothetical protein
MLTRPDLHSEKDDKRNEKGILEILEVTGVAREDERENQDGALKRQLPDGNIPRVILESEIQDDLGHNGVDSTVEDPALDGKGKG